MCFAQWQKVGACACGGGAAGWPASESLFCRKYIRFHFTTAAASSRSAKGLATAERELSLCFAFSALIRVLLIIILRPSCEANFYCRTLHVSIRSSTNIARLKKETERRERSALDTLNGFSSPQLVDEHEQFLFACGLFYTHLGGCSIILCMDVL